MTKSDTADKQYLAGFGNEHSSEALAGALPIGQFSPQRPPFGLYAEKFSSTAFTAPREKNRRTWFYRLRPSVLHGDYQEFQHPRLASAPLADEPNPPMQLRWDPFAVPVGEVDFFDGLLTIAANGSAHLQTGIAIHLYLASRSMGDRYCWVGDGELLIVPQLGRLQAHTECGSLMVAPGEICVIPRGMKFSIALPDGKSRGYVCENYGAPLSLPERGPVGSDGFANDRDFLTPHAAFEDREGDFEIVCKFGGRVYRAPITHSPLDVVAWVGTSVPYKYALNRFMAINTVSFDHPDPSIFTVLSSPSDSLGIANVDFVIFPPRWMVGEHTFRPPWFHRNAMSEFMGLIEGQYDAKKAGFEPGGMSLHNGMVPHGPEAGVFENASAVELVPEKLADTMAFMFESRYLLQPTRTALTSPHLQDDYRDCWQGLDRNFAP